MPPETIPPEELWLSIIGRSLALLCLKNAELPDDSLGAKARFLESLGLPRKDVAAMLNTTPASITELLRLARKKKGNHATRKKR